MDVMPGEPRDRYAITIQRWTRGWLSRKRAARLAALSRQEKLQRRAQVLRERLQISEQERRYLEQLDPAACIEYWRKRDRASLDIQRYYRGWCVRKRADLMRARCQRSQVRHCSPELQTRWREWTTESELQCISQSPYGIAA